MRIKGAKVSNPNDFVTCPGSRMKDVFTSFIQDDGTLVLKKSSEFDFQEYIESFRDKTDMAWIIQQLKLGNPNVLNRSPMYYADFTDFPKTYAEVLQLNINAKKTFNDLPLEVRRQYDMDFNKWFADFGSDEWLKMCFPEKFKEKVDQPVVSDNSETGKEN